MNYKRKMCSMRRSIIYARVSSKEQEKEGFSIPSQLKLLKSYAQDKGFKVAREYVDIETAKKSGRKEFSEMVEFLKSERRRKDDKDACRVILVEKTDRLYRNIKDWVFLDDLELEIHLVKENAILSKDSRSSEKFMHGIKVLMAKNYIDNLSEETRKGMIEKAEQGYFPSSAPFGYINEEEEGKKIINSVQELAPLIKRLYEWYATGQYSLLEVKRKFHSECLILLKDKRIKANKSLIYKILTNPVYYGGFKYAGKLYQGKHTPIISKELFDRVQQILALKGKRRTRHQKHNWAFQGLINCGHCGCALTAEIKKGKYVYYHCTGHKGKCPEKYTREEEIARQFGESLEAIKMDAEVLEWVKAALKDSHKDEKKYHDEAIALLQKKYQILQDRLDAMYVDKLDGEVNPDFYEKKNQEWREEQAQILNQIDKYQQASQNYFEDGAKLLELSQKAVSLYEKQEMREKRRILDFVFSNSTWKDECLHPTYRQPFELLAVTNESYQKENAASGEKSDISSTWLPLEDSNLD